MLSLAINPRLEIVGNDKEIAVEPSYTLLIAVIPEIVIAFALIAAVGFVA